jgi:hypothetical protein
LNVNEIRKLELECKKPNCTSGSIGTGIEFKGTLET